MSIVNGTTHYGYPQVELTDRPTFADFNPAFRDIDAKLYGLITGATTDHAAIEALQTGLGETNLALAGVKDTADASKAKADANEENIGILQTSLGNTDRTVATKLDSVAIAEPYDASAGTYAVGDIVVYNGQRYRCTTAVSVAEPFDADKWTGEDVETVLTKINSDLTWKLADNVLLDGSIDLTGIEYSELSIEVADSTLNTIYQQVIPRVNIPEVGAYYYLGGYYATPTSSGSVRLILSKTNVKVDEYYLNGSVSSDVIALGVWYR